MNRQSSSVSRRSQSRGRRRIRRRLPAPSIMNIVSGWQRSEPHCRRPVRSRSTAPIDSSIAAASPALRRADRRFHLVFDSVGHRHLDDLPRKVGAVGRPILEGRAKPGDGEIVAAHPPQRHQHRHVADRPPPPWRHGRASFSPSRDRAFGSVVTPRRAFYPPIIAGRWWTTAIVATNQKEKTSLIQSVARGFGVAADIAERGVGGRGSALFPVKTEEIRQNKKIPINLPTKGQARPPSFAVGRGRLFRFMICSSCRGSLHSPARLPARRGRPATSRGSTIGWSMPARVPISMAAPVPSDPTGRCPRGRPRKIPAAPPATERVPSGENLSGVPEHNPVPPGPPDDDVAITKIGEEAGTFLGVSRRAFAVVISDIADHLQCMLVERQQIESKMSAAAIAIQRSSGRTWTGVLCQAMRVVARRDRLRAGRRALCARQSRIVAQGQMLEPRRVRGCWLD